MSIISLIIYTIQYYLNIRSYKIFALSGLFLFTIFVFLSCMINLEIDKNIMEAKANG